MTRSKIARRCESGQTRRDSKGASGPAPSGSRQRTEIGDIASFLDTPSVAGALADATRGDGSDATNVAGEVYLRLRNPRIAAKYDPERGSTLAFAIGIGRLVRRESLRAGARHTSHEPVHDTALRSGTTSLDGLVRQEALDALAVALADLPARDRALVLMRFGCGPCGQCRHAPLNGSERGRLCRVLKKLAVVLAPHR